MKKTKSYLSSLRFNPELWNSWHAKYLVQIRVVIMLILSIVGIGLFAYFNLPRRLNPEIKIPIVVVSTVLPGASPQDLESLVTIPLEDKINDIEGIDTLTSSSLENSSIITIQFLSTKDPDKAKDEVLSAVDSVTDLPEDATEPVVMKLNFEDQPIWNFAIITDKDAASLNRFSKDLRKVVEDLPVVDRVATSGIETQEIEVVILPQKAKEYGITPIVLSQTVQAWASSYPAGNVQTTNSSFSLSIDKDVLTIDDIRNLRLSVNNASVKLGEIASVSLKSTPNQKLTLYGEKGNVKSAIQFFVYKTSGSNIDQAEQVVKKEVESYLEGQDNFKLLTIVNAAEEIVDQFNELTGDFFFTVILVFTLLLIFLGLKQAIIASVTVPLTFLASFAIINALGLSLNFLTMFAFLIALGLLIDDTIVTVAAMTRYYATNKFSPAQTGILVWKDFITPLWSTTVTTIWAFLPLLLATGIIGEFIKSIPIVVTATMLSSTSIAVFITIPLMIVFLKPTLPKRVKILFKALAALLLIIIFFVAVPKNALFVPITISAAIFTFITYRIRNKIVLFLGNLILKNKKLGQLSSLVSQISRTGLINIETLSSKYMYLINRILMSQHGKRNTLIAVVAFALCAYLLVPLGFVKNEFFPKQDTDILYLSVELPSGSSVDVANREAKELLNKVKEESQINFAIAEAGASFAQDMQGRSSSSNGLLITLHLTDMEKRSITSSEIAQNLRKTFSNYSKGVLTIQEQSGGPPAGADLSITLLGDDPTALDSFSNKIIEFLKVEPGVTNVNKSIKSGTSKIVFTPDKDKLLSSGLSVDSLSLWMRTYATGFSLDQVKFGGDENEYDVVFRLSAHAQTPEDLGLINIPSQNGPIPLLSLGELSLSTNPTVINRESGKRSTAVTATVTSGFNVADKNKNLEDFARNQLNLPSGYSWKTGGVNEENQKSVNSILQAMVISFFLILITMVIEFRSFRQTFIALAIIPLSVAGVLYVFALTNTPLSFPALIGILALFGIVVTHAIVVIEKINDNIREGLQLKDAIIDAAGSRLEPVLLTSLATIAGLIPITLSDPLWRGLGGAIIAGLLFSGAIKLFFVPVTYYLFFALEKSASKRQVR